jgi:ADP-heptose:LPS heptosyltransferase
LEVPGLDASVAPVANRRVILIHSGAAQPIRVWPLERFQALALHLRQKAYSVQIACDPGQRQWWDLRGENVAVPSTISELMAVIDKAALFVGNDSGPGHLAATMGIPTFTIFGNQIPSELAPCHPEAQWIEGKPCPYKPCHDYCRLPTPECLLGIGENEALPKISSFAAKHLGSAQ